MLDVEKIRKDFPMLQNNPDLLYFDNAATTLKPQCVIDAVTEFYTKHTSNVHRGDYALAALNDRLYDGARSIFAKLIHCHAHEIVFTHNVTQSMNQIVYGMQKNFLHAGDTVLVTLGEHASNILPWFRLEKEGGIHVEYIETDAQGVISIASLKKAMHPGVKAISIAQMTNVLGSLQPLKEIIDIAHAAGAYVIVDGAQSVPHMPVDVQALDIDFLGFSAHKMCGPSGVGILYGKYELLKQMDPLLEGGDMNARFEQNGSVLLKEPPVRFEAGTPNIEGVLGAGKAAEYLMSVGLDQIHAYEKELHAYFAKAVQQLHHVVLYNADNTFGPIDFNVCDPQSGQMIFAQDAAGYLASRNIAVRSGNHCAKLLHHIIGIDQTIRASLYFYNTKEEIDQVVEAIRNISLANTIGVFFQEDEHGGKRYAE